MKNWLRKAFGFPERSTLPDMNRREAVYDRLFGKCAEVSHELLPLVPHIDVYVYEPGYQGRDFFTLVTGGLSDVPMKIPPGPSSPRAELVLYAREPKPLYINYLRYLAHIPHPQETWFAHGTTMTNGQPPEPIFEGSVLDCVLFLFPIVAPDARLGDRLKIEEDPVNLLWVVPITQAECQLCIDGRLDELLDLFDQNQHPVVLDEHRRSYV